ncbi:MAG: methyltransferase domain-containing protein [Acidobacteria bacterium]|nr:methyltransferase domain-containing protein [Acidobacteriota bacterium]
MTAYTSTRVAAAYAFDRPHVHERLMDVIVERLRIGPKLARALDIGSGAGLSTAPLDRLAARTIGLEPMVSMLTYSRVVAPRAVFVAGHAERLPFGAASFDVVTAAGAINYADRDLCLPEIARVLTAAGALVVYDFSVGRRLRDNAALERWHDAFERRFPSPPGYELDVRALPFARAGLRLDSFEELAAALPMDLASYVRYVMSEARIELALSRGEAEHAIRDWCGQTLSPIFRDRTLDVIFDAYVAIVRRG